MKFLLQNTFAYIHHGNHRTLNPFDSVYLCYIPPILLLVSLQTKPESFHWYTSIIGLMSKFVCYLGFGCEAKESKG